MVDGLKRAIQSAGALGLDVATLDERQRAALERVAGVVVEGGRVRAEGSTDPLAGHPFVRALEANPFSPPDPHDVDRAELRELVRRGLVVERDGCYFAPTAIDEAARRVADLLATLPAGITVAQVRDALGTTRVGRSCRRPRTATTAQARPRHVAEWKPDTQVAKTTDADGVPVFDGYKGNVLRGASYRVKASASAGSYHLVTGVWWSGP